MPNPRTPTAKAKITGAASKNPQRFTDRADPKVGALGKPYKRMTPAQVAHWESLAEELPWLASSDRQAVRQLSELLAEADMLRDAGDPVPQGLRTQIRMYLNSFGASPADRSRISAPDDGDGEDPAMSYIQ